MKLFEEFKVGPLVARNRAVRSATAESLCTKEGVPSKRLIDYYCELSEGDVGTIITGYSYVCEDGKPSERSMSLADDSLVAVLREMADAVHVAYDEPSNPEPLPAPGKLTADGKIVPADEATKEETRKIMAERASAEAEKSPGARLVAQLVYGGSKSKLAADDPRRIADAAEGAPNVDIVGPSAVMNPATGLIPHEASKADIKRIVEAFAAAASRVQKAGFDGVEVHAGHGYLLSQFLDGRFNKRTDEYGGPIENRARFACECVAAIREKTGADFPIFVKLNSCDVAGDTMGEQGGMSEAESMQVAQMLVEAGASCIDVSGDWHAIPGDEVDGEPFFGSFGTRLAHKVDVPVIVTGGWRDLDIIERYLETTGIQGIGMSRPFICEPFLIARWSVNNLQPSRCYSCNKCTKQAGIPCFTRGHK